MVKEVITFGCRLNSYESEIIREGLAASTMQDVAVFNTCAVTKEAERQARQSIRRYIRKNPRAKIIVTGCAAQINPGEYASIKGVHKVLGNEEKLKAEYYSFTDAPSEEKIAVNDIMAVEETASHMVQGLADRSRAFMQVQNGCDHRCTFCIIPYGRGNSRSVPMGEIVKQAKILLAQGYKEIVLTGVDITDYGKNLPGNPSLGQMMKRLLAAVPELPRLRLSSIDVAEIDDDLFRLITAEKRFMPHLHLSLQAGDNMILKRMKRRHTREEVIDFCAKVRKLRPEVVFGADIIAGFPTETEEMFQNTVNIIKEAGITYLHVFPYSEREGTPAANIPQNRQVPKEIRKERAAILRALGAEQVQNMLKLKQGTKAEVVMEKEALGRTEYFATVKFDENVLNGKIGDLIPVEITGIEGDHLKAVQF